MMMSQTYAYAFYIKQNT